MQIDSLAQAFSDNLKISPVFTNENIEQNKI